MKPANKALEILYKLLPMSLISSVVNPRKPGAVVERYCKGKDREILNTLNSNDIKEVRTDEIFDDRQTVEAKKISKELKEIDKRFNRNKI